MSKQEDLRVLVNITPVYVNSTGHNAPHIFTITAQGNKEDCLVLAATCISALKEINISIDK